MRLVRVAAAVLAGAAVLTGCSDRGTANETLPSTSVIPSENTASLPPLGPPDLPVPAEARDQTPAGATAALRYYLALITHQAGKGGEPLRDLSHDCDFCNFIAKRYDNDAATGITYAGGDLTITSMSTPALANDAAEFSFLVNQSAIQVTGPDGEPAVGRGQEALASLNAGARMTWSEQARAWFMNQVIINNEP